MPQLNKESYLISEWILECCFYFMNIWKFLALSQNQWVSLNVQVREAKAAAEKAQQLLQNVANRKKNRQMETGGLVITKAVYGSRKTLTRDESRGSNDESVSQVIDVTLPLNFLVNDSGQLRVCFLEMLLLEFLFSDMNPVYILLLIIQRSRNTGDKSVYALLLLSSA